MKQYISMERIINDLKYVVPSMEELKEVDTIIAITRGGLVPAQFVAYELNCKNILTVQVETYEDNESKLDNYNGFDKLDLKDSKKILVVDDICDTGNTLKIVRQQLSNIISDDVEVEELVIINKSESFEGVSLMYDDTKDWIVFPWDEDGIICERDENEHA